MGPPSSRGIRCFGAARWTREENSNASGSKEEERLGALRMPESLRVPAGGRRVLIS